MKRLKVLLILMVLLGAVSRAGVANGAPVGEAFTYQGRLIDSNTPADGLYDLRFRLYDAPTGGNQLGAEIDVNDLDLMDGYFTVGLDFGNGLFDGNKRWLEIAVRPGDSNDPNDRVIVDPRQEIRPTPYASHAMTAQIVQGGVTGGGEPNSIAKFSEPNVVGSSSIYEDRGRIGVGTQTPKTLLHIYKGLGGASNPVAGIDLLAIESDDYAYLNFITRANKVAGIFFSDDQRNRGKITYDHGDGSMKLATENAVRIMIKSDGDVGVGTLSPKEKLDVDGNVRVRGKATIGPDNTNEGADTFVAGNNNSATGDQATVSGGKFNDANGYWTTIGGGFHNTAVGDESTVAGGRYNMACGGYATVGGGFNNDANGYAATVAGGFYNRVSNDHASIGGGNGNVATREYATVGGGHSNEAYGDSATVGGGYDNKGGGMYATVAGGRENSAALWCSTVAGGMSNEAHGSYASVPGGEQNSASGQYSLAAGRRAKALHDGALVWADSQDADFESTGDNQFLIRASGGVGIGPTEPTAQLDVAGKTGYNQVRMRTPYTPKGTKDENGNVGDMAWDDGYFYVKTGEGWKRVRLETF
jgi:hypothetical protein